MEDIIRVRELTKYYDSLLAVDHLDFEVQEGEIFGFLGPNGAGKTTTIRMLTGLSLPSKGTAYINGYNIRNEIVEIKRRVGVVPETSNLYNELTVRNNLLFMAGLYHVPKRERKNRVQTLLEHFRLEDKSDVRFGRLSRGLKRRVTVATALIHQPPILFLDEPTTGLDVMSARSLRSLLKELKETGVTIFLTTHYIEEADQLCDRVAIIVKGKIVTVDTPDHMKASIQEIPVIEVSFNRPVDQLNLQELGVSGEIRLEETQLRILTIDVLDALTAITKFAARHGLKITNVKMTRPTLEDAFVQLAGVESKTMVLEKEGRRQS